MRGDWYTNMDPATKAAMHDLESDRVEEQIARRDGAALAVSIWTNCVEREVDAFQPRGWSASALQALIQSNAYHAACQLLPAAGQQRGAVHDGLRSGWSARMNTRYAITTPPRPMTIEERAHAISDHAQPGMQVRGRLRQERIHAEALKMLQEVAKDSFNAGMRWQRQLDTGSAE